MRAGVASVLLRAAAVPAAVGVAVSAALVAVPAVAATAPSPQASGSSSATASPSASASSPSASGSPSPSASPSASATRTPTPSPSTSSPRPTASPTRTATPTPTPAARVPGAPTVRFTREGDRQLTVGWNPPASDGGSKITYYRLYVVGSTGLSCSTATATSCTVKDLTNGHPYVLRVRAVNRVGAGPASEAVGPLTPHLPATVPSPPRLVSAAVGDARVSLRWTPTGDGGSPVTGYVVSTRPDGTARCRTWKAAACTVDGLTNGQAYTFVVVARNAVGVSAPSAPLTATPVAPAATALPVGVGDLGPLVTSVQQRLVWAGVPGPVTGRFDERTAQQVRHFQTKFFLGSTGRVNAATWARLKALTRSDGRLPSECLSRTSLCIDKSQKVLRYVVGGNAQMVLDARFGGSGTPTREGTYSVFRKSRDHYSSLYGSWMPFAMFFSGGQAVHYSPYFHRDGYSGASHGCVNIRDKAAVEWLFDHVPMGTRVVVYRS